MISKTLGHYQITSQLGKGGMGEVYQAKDQKLGRDVAIKILPEEFAKDTDRVARFQREAKLLASLNHTNIAAIYGLEESAGTNFLVLELVEGETLADQIKRGPIPVEESLKLALQIAEALEAAHEKGVIHRDLKPANIKVMPDGKVKVLDFGLAKAFAGEQAELNLSNSPTLSDAATQQGVILGTAAYMSPEQARGKFVDRRADIWAFGCVLFEMLTGRATFSGQDVTEILAAVIRADPEWSSLPANLHWRLREVLERCLKKDMKDRYHDISDVRVDIQRVLADPNGVFGQPEAAGAPRKRNRATLSWIAAVILAAMVVGVVIWNFKPSPRPESRQVTRFSYELPKDFGGGLAVSPDGRQFVYSTPSGLYLRSFDELEARLIPGTEGSPSNPFFSPDGKWIGYWAGANAAKLRKISISGGTPIDLCDLWLFGGAAWNQDNTIIYSDRSGTGAGIMLISANGGSPKQLIRPKGMYAVPQLLPDGRSVLFTDISTRPFKIRVQSLESGIQKELFDGVSAHYFPTGHIIYVTGNGPYNLVAIPFSLEKLEAIGGPVPVLNGMSNCDISDSGTLIYVPSSTQTSSGMRLLPVWVDQKGKEEPTAADAPSNFYMFNISPEGTRVALVASSGTNGSISIWDLKRETMTRLTFDQDAESWPLWTPDGKRVVFVSTHNNRDFQINIKAADGTGGTEKLASYPLLPVPYSWSRDGKALVFSEVAFLPQRADVSMISLEGDHLRTPLLQESYPEAHAKISPDGRWVAYTSTESGKNEIYVRPFPEVNNGKWLISTGNGVGPLWARDGRRIFYRSDDAVMEVGVETEPAFKFEKPKVLFRGNYFYMKAGQAVEPAWDISPDGRFMMMKVVQPTEKATSPQAPLKINIVLNWFEELKQRVPTGK